MSFRTVRARFIRRCICVMLAVVFCPLGMASASSTPVRILAVQSPELSSEVGPETELTEEDRERRKQMLSVSWILLIGIALLCGIALLIVVYLGARARRIARKDRPQTPLKNEFWYLNNETPADAEPEKDESA